MCDFAHDPEEVRQLKEDVRTMLVDNPAKLMWMD
jgi:hypothetical protein